MSLSRETIVTEARSWIGTPYRHQATLRGVGADCLGLVRGVWRACVGPEPQTTGPYSPDWAEATGQERLLEAGLRWFDPSSIRHIQPGDVLMFRWRAHIPAKHLGIATSPGMMVHAHDGASVAEVALSPWWVRHLAYAFAFPGLDG